jgi:IMP dehydrogenase
MNFPKVIFDGITYDDVLLIPQKSEILPRETSLVTKLSKNITLSVPFLSAAMDTVTNSEMARAIARVGGFGVIHKNMTIAQQASEVDKVKRSESGMILDPITLQSDAKIADAQRLMAKYHISGIPVIDSSKKLIGIITNRDLRFNPHPEELISKVMTSENIITAPLGTTLEEAEIILQGNRIEKLPVVDSNNILQGLITFKDIQKKKLHPNACKDNLGRLRVGAAVGVTADTFERVQELVSAGVDAVFVDTAHGHSFGVINMVREIKKRFSNLDVIGGNIATGEAAQELIDAGADGLKVGIGPGSICTTRIIAGVGVPQLSAIMLVSDVAKKHGIPIIADGGIKQTGDIAKAIVAGADSVMIGNLFAGAEESPGEKILLEGRPYKVYRGMGSLGAMTQGSADRYFQDVEDEISKFVPEGIEGRVPLKGPAADIVYQFTGGLRSAMGYCGCKDITELQQNGKFVRITGAGLRESHPHNIVITKESPNYFAG